MTTETTPTETTPSTPVELPETITLSRDQFAMLLAHGNVPKAAPDVKRTGYEYDEHLCGAPRTVAGQVIGGCNMPVEHIGDARSAVEHTIYATDQHGQIKAIGTGNDYRAQILDQWNALFRGEGRVKPGLVEGVNDGPELCEFGCFPYGWQLHQASQSCAHGSFTR